MCKQVLIDSVSARRRGGSCVFTDKSVLVKLKRFRSRERAGACIGKDLLLSHWERRRAFVPRMSAQKSEKLRGWRPRFIRVAGGRDLAEVYCAARLHRVSKPATMTACRSRSQLAAQSHPASWRQ